MHACGHRFILTYTNTNLYVFNKYAEDIMNKKKKFQLYMQYI